MVGDGLWNESLRCGRKREVRERVEKRRRVIAAIVAIWAEVIRTRVEDWTWRQFSKWCLVRVGRKEWGPWGCSVSKLAAWPSTLAVP